MSYRSVQCNHISVDIYDEDEHYGHIRIEDTRCVGGEGFVDVPLYIFWNLVGMMESTSGTEDST